MGNIELLNEDDGFDINPEAVAEGDYIMRCLREGKDPFETKSVNESAMEKNKEILESINEDANSPIPMVGMDQPIIVIKMFKNAFNQDDSKIYISKDHMFSSIFEADGIGNIIECTMATSTLTPDDIKSESTRVTDITQEQYEEFVYAKENDISFNEAIKTILIDEESLITEARSDIKAINSHFNTIIEHMLKWKYQPTEQNKKWCEPCLTYSKDILEDIKPSDYSKIYTYQNTIDRYKNGRMDAINHEMRDHNRKINIPKDIVDPIFEDLKNLTDLNSIYNFMYENRNVDRKQAIEGLQYFASKIGVEYDTKGDPRYFRY